MRSAAEFHFVYEIVFCFTACWPGQMIRIMRILSEDKSEQLKQLVAALKESEFRYRQIVQNLPAAYYTCDAEGHITFYNQAAVVLWGMEPRLGKDKWCGSWKIYRPDGTPMSPDECPMGIALREGRAVTGEEIIIERPDGVRRNVLPHPQPIFNSQGEVSEAFNMLVDITEHKNVIEALYESEDRFRNMADHTPMFVWMTDQAGHITYCNKTLLNYLGFTHYKDFRVNTWQKITHTDDKQYVSDTYDLAFRLRQAYTLECRIQDAVTGQYRWFLVKGVPRYTPNHEFYGFIATGVDIHERKEAEQEIKESIDRIHFLADAMPQKVWTVAPEGNIMFINRPWLEYTGFTFEEMRAMQWKDIIHPEDWPDSDKAWNHSLETGRDFEIEHRFRRKDGEYRWHLTRGIAQRNEQGKILMWVGTNTDIHDKKQVEEELRRANKLAEQSIVKRDKALQELMQTKKQLEELMVVKEQFLSNMSHEIRTPMNAIVGFTELLLKTPVSSDQKQYLDAIKTSGENLLVIINDILDFSKLQAGAFTFEKTGFRLSQVISMLTEMMLPKSTEKGIKLSVTIDKNIPDHLIGDPTRLNQILLNLAGNAIKFTEKGEVKIQIRTLMEDEKNIELKFSVIDTGIGIPVRHLNSIFEAFTQATSHTTRKYGGTGLGLSIVKQYVEKQGGVISVQSKVGAGSVFWFTLKFGKDQRTNFPETTPHEEEFCPEIEGLNVLLVEDNRLNQILATKVLNGWNWNVELAENGLVAIEKLEKQDFDLVLMDIQLPEMDGYEATRYIRKRFSPPKSNIPIMAMTAHALANEEKKCFEVGMNGYISKPFSSKVLYPRIVSILRREAERDG